MSAAYRVLVVDDEPGLVRALAINLRAHGWDVVTAHDGRSALAASAEAHPDVVVHDILTLAPALSGEILGLPVATLVPHVDPRTAPGAPP